MSAAAWADVREMNDLANKSLRRVLCTVSRWTRESGLPDGLPYAVTARVALFTLTDAEQLALAVARAAQAAWMEAEDAESTDPDMPGAVTDSEEDIVDFDDNDSDWYNPAPAASSRGTQ